MWVMKGSVDALDCAVEGGRVGEMRAAWDDKDDGRKNNFTSFSFRGRRVCMCVPKGTRIHNTLRKKKNTHQGLYLLAAKTASPASEPTPTAARTPVFV